ncbi:MAG: peroxiredoxin [Sphingomonadaceae bacterium]
MRHVSLFGLLALAITAPVQAALPVGAKAPDFVTRGARAGKPFAFQLASALKRGPVVLFFFPAAFTPGCTIEARRFAEAADDFAKAGATLIGLSADPLETLARFSIEECRSKFPVAVATPAMIEGFDVRLATTAQSNRTSYVINRNGRIAFAYAAKSPDGHVEGTLAAVRAMARPTK